MIHIGRLALTFVNLSHRPGPFRAPLRLYGLDIRQ